MKFRRKLIIIIVGLVLIGALCGLGYVFYKRIKEPTLPAINAIPLDAALVLKTNNISGTWEKISNNDIWKEIIGIEFFKKLHDQISFIQSNVEKSDKLDKLIKTNSLLISMHFSGDNKFDYLYLLKLPNNRQKSLFDSFFISLNKKKTEIRSRFFKGTEISTIQFSNTGNDYFYSIEKGIFIGSFNPLLIEDAITQLRSQKSISEEKYFNRVYITAGKKVDANIYINYKYFYRHITKFAKIKFREDLNFISALAKITELDLKVKKDELLLNGYTVIENSPGEYLNIFRDNQPPEIELTNILPNGTAYFIYFGFEDKQKYYRNLKSYMRSKNEKNQKEKIIQAINRKYNINIEERFLSCIGNEMALVVTRSKVDELKQNTYAVIRAESSDDDNYSLYKLLDDIRNGTTLLTERMIFKDFQINHLDVPNLIPALFGPVFENLENSYFTSIDNYYVFANSVYSLKIFINSYLSNRSLGKSKSYIDFSDNVSGSANLYFYFNFSKGSEIIKSYFEDHYSAIFEEEKHIIHKLQALAIQFSFSKNNMFYSNVYLKHNPDPEKEEENELDAVWETMLDTTIIKQPYFIKDHITNTLKIVVFDAANNMYLIDEYGNIVWKIPVAETIQSDVYLVDYYQNDKYQYLFSTKNFFYLIDLNGNNVADYPIKLNAKATNGVSLFDYSNNKEYRLMIACEDNKIINYTKEGKVIKGWRFQRTRKPVKTGIVHFVVAEGKDYIVFSDTSGRVYITNRKGEERIKIKQPFINFDKTKFFLDDSGGNFLTTDQSGKIIKVAKSGEISSIVIKDFSLFHDFLYEDFDSNNIKDYIYLDSNQLFVFNNNKDLIYNYDFPTDVSPNLYSFKDGRIFIFGVVSLNTNEVYLFNKNGRIEREVPILGKTPFIIGSFRNNKQYNLIIGLGNYLNNYTID